MPAKWWKYIASTIRTPRAVCRTANRKVKGTLHWVSCAHCLAGRSTACTTASGKWKIHVTNWPLSAKPRTAAALDAMKEIINPDSLKILTNCYIEKYLANAKPLDYLQFQRIGYFNVDKDSTPEKLVFNRTVGLKDTWGKINK